MKTPETRAVMIVEYMYLSIFIPLHCFCHYPILLYACKPLHLKGDGEAQRINYLKDFLVLPDAQEPGPMFPSLWRNEAL